MSDDLRDRLADALTYKPGSSAYDYADRVLPIVWEYAVECQRAETARFALIAAHADVLASDAARDPGMYSGPADGFVWAAEAIRNAAAEVEE